MGRALTGLLSGIFLLSLAVYPVNAGKRVALVIGNSAYQHATTLRNPKADAEAIASLLEDLDFDVVTGTDLKMRDFADTVNGFAEKLHGANVALFYYAGHGLQVHGRNYLAPVDARLRHEAGLEFEAVKLRTILALMERRRRINLVFLDACRDNPLAQKLARNMGTRSTAVGRGWAREETGVGTLIAFATQPGNVALDGDGKHSPFAQALLEHSATPGLDIAQLMRRVRREVVKVSAGKQVPWSHSSLLEPFVFKEEIGSAPAAVARSRSDIEMMAMKRRLRELEKQLTQQQEPKETPKVAALTETNTQPIAPPKPETKLDGRELTLALQEELKRVGCDPGAIDGHWGVKGRSALSRFNQMAKLNIPISEPTLVALDALKTKTKRVCRKRKQCGAGKVLSRNGQCIAKTKKKKSSNIKWGSLSWKQVCSLCKTNCRKSVSTQPYLNNCIQICNRDACSRR